MTTEATLQTPEDVKTTSSNPVQARKAVRGAWAAFFVDLFDIYLPVIVLAPAITYFVSPDLGPVGISVVNGAIFAATLLGRPIGAFIFGHLADSVGRRRSTVIAMTGVGAATLAMALLPGYEHWGVSVVVVFVALRLLDGIFLGGQYTAANPLAMESSPKHLRGFNSALITSGFPLAYAAISLITLLLLLWLPAGDLDSPYVQWGWRLPFVLGAVMAFVLAIYYNKAITESEAFRSGGGNKNPLKTLAQKENLKPFLQVLLMVTGFWLSLQPVAAILPGVLQGVVGQSNMESTITLVIVNVIAAISYLPLGIISQKAGRRPFFIASGIIMAILGTSLYYLLLTLRPDSFWTTLAITTGIVVITFLPWPVLIAYINERFQTGVRASAYGLAYSLAVILPSFYFVYQTWLSALMPFEYTSLVLLAVGAVLISIGAAWGPETKDVDFISAGERTELPATLGRDE